MSGEAQNHDATNSRLLGLADVRDALRLAAHVGASDPYQLGGQLIGRLGSTRSEGVARLLRSARNQRERPTFIPLTPSLVRVGGPLRMTTLAHHGWVGAVALAQDGRLAVSAGDDGLIKIWLLTDGTCLHTFSGHDGPVRDVGVDADGRVVLSGGDDGTVRLWCLDTGVEIERFEHEGVVVRSVGIAADASVAVWIDDNAAFWYWKPENSESPVSLPGHRDRIRDVAISGDGRVAASIGNDGNIIMWDTNHARVSSSTGAPGAWGIALDELGATVAWGRKDHLMVTLDRTSGSRVERRGHGGLVRTIALTADGERIVTGSDDRTVRLWESATDKAVVLGEHAAAVGAVAIARSGRVAVSGSGDGSIKVWDLEAANRDPHIAQVMHHAIDFGVEGLAVLPDGSRAVSLAGDGSLKSWDLATLNVTGDYRDKETLGAGALRVLSAIPGGVVDVAFHPPRQTRVLRIWDLDARSLVTRLDAGGMRVNTLCASASGRLLLAGRHDGKLMIFDLTTGTRATVGPAHQSGILDVAISSDESRALTASSDGSVAVWETSDWDQRPLILQGDGPAATAVAGLHPGYLVAGYLDGVVAVWDVAGAKQTVRSQLHKGAVNALAVVPGTATVVSASADQTVRAWWPRHPARRSPAFTGQTAIKCVVVTPDGGTILAGESSGRIHPLRLIEAGV